MTGRVIVIGAGPAGMTAAYRLAAAGAEVHIYEASDHVGGMASTITLWGQQVDLGPHRFFSSDPRVNGVFREVVGNDFVRVRRFTRIFYAGKFFRYPLQAWNALSGLGLVEAVRCLASYVSVVLFPPDLDDSTFEGWVVRRFGRRLFEIFFRTYSEKLWGISCKDLDADFAAQRIKKFSLREAVWHALKPAGSSRHATLVEEFSYPLEGTGMIYDRMAASVRKNKGQVTLGRRIERLLVENNRVKGVVLEGGETLEADTVISSMPLTHLVKGLPSAPSDVQAAAGRLRFRNTILVYLLVNKSDLFRDQWLYVHAADLRCGRITNFRNWGVSHGPDGGTTVLALEYWCWNEDPLWVESDQGLVDLARKEINSTGLLGKSSVLEGAVKRLPRCYPVYQKGYKKDVAVVSDYVNSIQGVMAIGRYGAFKYNNQDHSILMGLLAAENILGQGRHDLWAINSDLEYQEEGNAS